MGFYSFEFDIDYMPTLMDLLAKDYGGTTTFNNTRVINLTCMSDVYQQRKILLEDVVKQLQTFRIEHDVLTNKEIVFNTKDFQYRNNTYAIRVKDLNIKSLDLIKVKSKKDTKLY